VVVLPSWSAGGLAGQALPPILFDVFGGKAEAAAKAGCDVSRARDGVYLGPLVDGLIGTIAEAIKAERKAVAQRLAEQDKKIGDGFRYRGVWTEGCAAAVGEVYTSGGSLWYCRAASTAKPGADSDAWTLAGKKGRDARDLMREQREPVIK
jgi:hypothetical protein